MGRRGSVFPGLTVPAAGSGRRESMLSPGATPSGGGRRGSMLPGLSVSPSNSRRGSKAVNTLGLWDLLLPPANEVCGKVIFFTLVCQSFCSQGSLYGGICIREGVCLQEGVCIQGGLPWVRGDPPRILQDMVNKLAIRILLECILVLFLIFQLKYLSYLPLLNT